VWDVERGCATSGGAGVPTVGPGKRSAHGHITLVGQNQQAELEADPTDSAAHGQVTPRGTLPGVVMGLVGPIAASAGDVPWESAAYTSTLGAALIGLQFVFPQESRDRLDWWIDLRRSRGRAAARRLARRRTRCVRRNRNGGRCAAAKAESVGRRPTAAQTNLRLVNRAVTAETFTEDLGHERAGA
jgi:hypothetical protein